MGKDRRKRKEGPDQREERINKMSQAFTHLCGLTGILAGKADELEACAPEVHLLKDYLGSGQWRKDFEADEQGELGPDVDRSVLSEDGLYNLLDDLDSLMRTFKRLVDDFHPATD